VANSADAAEAVSFQRHDAGFPPHKIANSAARSRVPASQFSENTANFAVCEAFTAQMQPFYH
jgi:hypothetical protein